jgi:putative transposase
MSREYRELCEALGIVQSVGRTGSCWDNSVSESFWATMKREMISRFRFATRAEARRVITLWINHYNALRQHSSINNMSPIEWELQFAQRQIQAA